VNIHGAQAFVIAMVPFDQIAINFCDALNPASSQVRAARCKRLVRTLT